MKHIIIIFLFSTNLLYSQYSYSVKLNGITTPELAKSPSEYIGMTFKTNPAFNDSLDAIEFKLEIPIVHNAFKYMIEEEGYRLILFNRVKLEEKKE